MFDFGLRIRSLRESRKMSQEMLGAKIGRSKPVISNYENNIKTPPLDVLISIANVFHVSLDYLVGFEKTTDVSVDGLSEKQVEILNLISTEFRENNNHNNELTSRQQKILSNLLVQFLMK